MHKPFLCQQAMLVSGFAGSHEWLRPHLQALEAYFACYDRYYLHETTGLYVWADDVMIGMDNDPATFGRPRFSTANVFLNGFMVLEMRAMAGILKTLGDGWRAARYEEKADALAGAIQRECWTSGTDFSTPRSGREDPRLRLVPQGLGVFWHTPAHHGAHVDGLHPAALGVATAEQAERIVRSHITDEKTFASPTASAPCPGMRRCTIWRPPTTLQLAGAHLAGGQLRGVPGPSELRLPAGGRAHL
jgi:putative isomerase